jgi:hypothetical protein
MPWWAVRQPLELARLRRTRAGVAEGDHRSVIRPHVDVDTGRPWPAGNIHQGHELKSEIEAMPTLASVE